MSRFELNVITGEVTEHPDAEVIPQEPTPVILTPLSRRQIRQALTRLNLRQAVEDAVAAGDQDTKDWWEFSDYYERNHPVVLSMVSTLGVSSEDTDNLWILGASL